MIDMVRGAVAASFLFVSSMASAQASPQLFPDAGGSAPVPAAAGAPMMVGPQAGTSILRSGTPVMLRTTTNLTTNGKHLKPGDQFGLEVSEAVLLDGQVVVPAGSPAVGEITSVRNKGMWGKSGNIETRLLYISCNGRHIRLTGQVGDKGSAGGGAAVAVSALVFLPAGFFMTGTSAVIPPGTIVHGILDEDIPVVFASAPPQAMTVQPSAPVQTSAIAPAGTAKVVPVSAPASSAQMQK